MRKIIGIAGGSGSGKTTFAVRLAEMLADKCTLISLDNYYKDASGVDASTINFDHPDSLDFELLTQNLEELKATGSTSIPNYDFGTHSRLSKHTCIEAKELIILEGILLFHHPDVVRQMDLKLFVDTSSDLRILRRILRDRKERSRDTAGIIDQYIKQVRPMHHQYVEPTKPHADLVLSGDKDILHAADLFYPTALSLIS